MATYLGNCISVGTGGVDALRAMIDQASRISNRTAMARVGRDTVAQVFPDYDWSHRPRDLTMKRDWHVAYFRSTFRGKPVVYVKHSAIEYIFAMT